MLGLDVDPDDAPRQRRRRRRRGSTFVPPLPSSVERDASRVPRKLLERHQREQVVKLLWPFQGIRFSLPGPELPHLFQSEVGRKDAVLVDDAVDLSGFDLRAEFRGRVCGFGQVGVVAADEGAVLREDGVALDKVGALSGGGG